MSNNQSSQHFPEKGEDQEHVPYTVIQTYEARHKINLSKTSPLITFETPKIFTKQDQQLYLELKISWLNGPISVNIL